MSTSLYRIQCVKTKPKNEHACKGKNYQEAGVCYINQIVPRLTLIKTEITFISSL